MLSIRTEGLVKDLILYVELSNHSHICCNYGACGMWVKLDCCSTYARLFNHCYLLSPCLSKRFSLWKHSIATSFIMLFLCLLRQTSQLLLLTGRGSETLMWQQQQQQRLLDSIGKLYCYGKKLIDTIHFLRTFENLVMPKTFSKLS